LGVPQRESVYVTSTLNAFLRYMGTGIWAAPLQPTVV